MHFEVTFKMEKLSIGGKHPKRSTPSKENKGNEREGVSGWQGDKNREGEEWHRRRAGREKNEGMEGRGAVKRKIWDIIQ